QRPQRRACNSEEDPLDPNPAPVFSETPDTTRYLEATLRGAEGIEGVALRYGTLYGPGSGISRSGYVGGQVRRRRLPRAGRGSGVWSFVHLEDVPRATVAALDRGAPTVYNIVDDDPARQCRSGSPRSRPRSGRDRQCMSPLSSAGWSAARQPRA